MANTTVLEQTADGSTSVMVPAVRLWSACIGEAAERIAKVSCCDSEVIWASNQKR